MASQLVTDSTFSETLDQGPETTFLYVWATWCGPCKMVKPHYLAVSELWNDEALFLDADLESFAGTSEGLGLKATPTIVAFRGGQEIARRTGAMMRSQLEGWVETQLQKDTG